MFASKETSERQIYQMIWAFCAAENFLEDYPLKNKKELCILDLDTEIGVRASIWFLAFLILW